MRVILIQLVVLIISNNVIAQEHPQKYSLEQCLNFAIDNSFDAHKANLYIEEATFNLYEARSNVLPQINASGNFDHSVLLPTTMVPGEIINQPGTQVPVQMGAKNAMDFSLTVEQVIFSPGLFTGIKIAKNNQDLQRLRATMTKEEIIFNVSNAFYDILNNMQELEHINYMISRQDSLYRLMEKRVEENVARAVDLNRIQINLSSLQASAKNVKSIISQQQRYFQILIGLPIEHPFELDISEAGNIEIPGHRVNLLVQNKPEINVLNKQKEVLELEIHSQKMHYFPTLSAIATAGYQFQSDRLDLTTKPWFSSAVIGVRLSVPVFDGLGTRSRIKQKQIQVQGADWDILEAQQNLAASYQNSEDQLEIIYELVQMQSENLKLAEKVFTQTMALYVEGLATITDLLVTETTLYEIKIAYAAEIIRYKKAEIDLLSASGSLDYLLTNSE